MSFQNHFPYDAFFLSDSQAHNLTQMVNTSV